MDEARFVRHVIDHGPRRFNTLPVKFSNNAAGGSASALQISSRLHTPVLRAPQLDVSDVVSRDAHRFGEGFLGEAPFAPEVGDSAAECLEGLVARHFVVDCTASLA